MSGFGHTGFSRIIYPENLKIRIILIQTIALAELESRQ